MASARAGARNLPRWVASHRGISQLIPKGPVAIIGPENKANQETDDEQRELSPAEIARGVDRKQEHESNQNENRPKQHDARYLHEPRLWQASLERNPRPIRGEENDGLRLITREVPGDGGPGGQSHSEPPGARLAIVIAQALAKRPRFRSICTLVHARSVGEAHRFWVWILAGVFQFPSLEVYRAKIVIGRSSDLLLANARKMKTYRQAIGVGFIGASLWAYFLSRHLLFSEFRCSTGNPCWLPPLMRGVSWFLPLEIAIITAASVAWVLSNRFDPKEA